MYMKVSVCHADLLYNIALQSETSLVIDQVITFGPLDTEIDLSFNVSDDSIALEETEVLEWLLQIITTTDRALVDPYNTTMINIIDDDGKVVLCCIIYRSIF